MNRETAYDKANRLHPLWIFSSIGKSVKEIILLIIAFAIYLDFDSDSFITIAAGAGILLFLIYKVAAVVLEWIHFQYRFTEKELCIHEGRFMKERRFIPLERIQGIKKSTPFFHRLFGLTSLVLDTGASGKKATIKLGMISFKEAERIQKLLSHIGPAQDKMGQISSERATENPSRTKYYEMTSREIIVASVTSLSLLIFLSVLYTIYTNVKDFFSIDRYIDAVISYFRQSWVLTAAGILILLVLSMAYGWLRTYLLYRNFEVTGDRKRIYIRKGLFNQTEFSIPKEKVEAIILNTKLLKKMLGIVEVKIISTGDGDDSELKTANILFPFIDRNRALPLISEILPAFQVETEMVKLPRSAILVKLIRTSYLWIGAGAITYYFWPGFWYLPLVLFVLIAASQLLSGLYSSYTLRGPFIQIQTGSFSTQLFITTRRKIEELKVTQTGLQRRFGLASLEIATRSKSIQMSNIADIPREAASRYYQWYAGKEK